MGSKLATEEEVSVSEVVNCDVGPRSAIADTPVKKLEKEEEMKSQKVKLKLATEEGASASDVVDSDVEPRSAIVNTLDSGSLESSGIPANPICSVSRGSQSSSALEREDWLAPTTTSGEQDECVTGAVLPAGSLSGSSRNTLWEYLL